ncbi:site-specific integrase [Rhodococcus sp. 3Y1]
MRRADLAGLVVPDVGRLISTGSEAEPYRLLDASGEVIGAATLFFEELHACDRSSATIRSYGHDLLRWWRFLAAVDVGWERASPAEGRDFARWMKIADKPRREHWRRRGEKVSGTTPVGAMRPRVVIGWSTRSPASRGRDRNSPRPPSARGNGVAGVLRFSDEHRCWAGRQSVPGGSLAPRFSVERASRSAGSVS